MKRPEITKKTLAEVAAETVNCRNGAYMELWLDTDDGSMWTKWYADENSFTQYRDSAIVKVANISRHHSAESIMALVDEFYSWQEKIDQ